jgi:hypothetical protein
MNPTPACPKGLVEYRCEYCDIDLIAHLEYIPAQKGSTGSFGEPLEPSFDEDMDLVSIYVAGTDADIYPIISASFVKDIVQFALLEIRNNTP